MPLPTFLGIGAQRSATSWLYFCLKEHPQVCMAEAAKEVHFFSSRYERGLDWYARQFVPGPEHRAIGEISPDYLAEPDAIARIARDVPDARLIVILREPVDRAYSAYRLFAERFAGRSFLEACAVAPYLVQHSLYGRNLTNLFGHVPREQTLVLLHEHVDARPHDCLRQVFSFIGVDPDFRPRSTAQWYNRSMYPNVQRWARQMHMDRPMRWLKRSPLGDLLRRTATPPGAAPGGPTDAERRAARPWFEADIEQLETLLDLDLSAWRAQPMARAA